MDAATARSIARSSHPDQRTRAGSLVTEHVERVAASVAAEARSVAFLHDVLERSDVGVETLVGQGLTPLELEALRLLTREAAESYELYILRIAHAPGAAGRIARTIKLADLDDHLREAPGMVGVPPYAWARRRLEFARDQRDGPGLRIASGP